MTTQRISIDATTLDSARTFFEDCGSLGCEGTGLIAWSTQTGDTRFIAPDQVATPVPACTVEVTDKGKIEAAVTLTPDERYVARIHSHPAEAFHSYTDDKNPAVTHDGAISIVVPYFGLGLRHGLDACALYLRRGGRWISVPPGPDRGQLVTVR